MALNNEPIFNDCLIKTKKNFETPLPTIITEEPLDTLDTLDTLVTEPTEEKPPYNQVDDVLGSITTNENDNVINNDSNEVLDIEIEDLNKDGNEEDTNDLKEISIDLNLENNLETINLKKPNQVYFELYKEARNKAKNAKKNAILAYLEAKNIKKTYLIDNLNDSDSDFDAEIDEVSESELEGL